MLESPQQTVLPQHEPELSNNLGHISSKSESCSKLRNVADGNGHNSDRNPALMETQTT